MKRKWMLVIILMTAGWFFPYSLLNAEGMTVSGVITNWEKVKAKAPAKAYLQMVKIESKMTFKTDEIGLGSYDSEFPRVTVRKNGAFTINIKKLPPGEYLIALQRADAPIPVVSQGGNPVKIKVPGSSPLDLGNTYIAMTDVHPESPEFYYNRGVQHYQFRRFAQAIADFNQAIKVGLNNSDVYFDRASAHQELGQLDQAIADYSQAAKLDPTRDWAYYYRGIAFLDKGEYDRAIADFNRHISLRPDNSRAFSYRGLAYAKKGLYDQAISDCNQALKIYPKLSEAYYHRAAAQFGKKAYDQAWADVRQAESFGGYRVPAKFVEELRRTSGRDR